MATNPRPDIEVLKDKRKYQRGQSTVENWDTSEIKKKSDSPLEEIEEEEEWWESPSNFFFDRKYLDF